MSELRTVVIEKIVAGGDGLARLDEGRIVFVPGVLPGERAEIEVTGESRDFGRGTVVRLLESSADRRVPPCPHVAEGCGGCDWQHISPAAQSRVKVDIVTEAFARTGKLTVTPRLRTLDDTSRRTTVRMAAGEDGVPGFRMGASNEVVAVNQCMVADQRLNDLMTSLRFEGEGEVTLRVSASGERGVHVHEGKLIAAVDEGVVRGARGALHETVAGHRFRVSMGSFFQSSPEAAELLVDVVTRRLNALELGEGGTFIDAYGGVGLFARALAHRFDEIVLVESNPQACRDAIENLADCAATVVQSEFERWDPCPARVVVADPARKGLGKGGVASVVGTDAEVVVLVSCDPVAGARDARMLVDAGYQLGDVEVLDIFPETHHVEVVSVFTRIPG